MTRSGPAFYLFILLFISILSACDQAPSEIEPPDSLTPTPIDDSSEKARTEREALIARLGWQNLKPFEPGNNPIEIRLDPVHHADANALVTLRATTSSGQGEIQRVRWLPEQPSEAIILDPYSAQTQIWLPHVTERTTLPFRLAVSDKHGHFHSAVVEVVVKPLATPLPITASRRMQDNQVTLDLQLSPTAGEPDELFYTTQAGTATADLDYQHTEGPLPPQTGGDATYRVSVPLANTARDEGRYFFILIQGSVNGSPLLERILIPLPAQQPPLPQKPETPPATHEGASDAPQEQLSGQRGPVRMHLEWQSQGDQDAVLQLRVTDPCLQELTLQDTKSICQDTAGYYESLPGNLPDHNVVWPITAPDGEFDVAVEHVSGGTAEYRIRLFWGEESAQYAGYIGPDEKLTVAQPTFTPVDHWKNRTLPRPSQPNANLAAGNTRNLALGVDGRLWSWGDNAFEPAPDDLANLVALAVGDTHSLALDAEGVVHAWGDNSYGQSNPPENLHDAVALGAGAQHCLALRENGHVVSWGFSGTTGPVPLGLRAVAIASGAYHNLALTADGTAIAWGDNDYGQTDVPANLQPLTAIAAGKAHSLGLTEDGTVVAWGRNNAGQTTIPDGLDQVTAISAGGNHSLALRVDGTVIAWGDNSFGQGDVPTDLAEVVSIAAGETHSVAFTADGLVIAWGGNASGQLELPEALAEQQRYESRKHMSLLVLRGANVDDIQAPQFGESTECSPIRIPEFTAPEDGFAVAAATTVYLLTSGTTQFSFDGTIDALAPAISEQAGVSGVRLFTAGDRVAKDEPITGSFSFSPNVSEDHCLASSFFVANADYVAHAWSPTNTDHGLTEVSLIMPEETTKDDLLILITMHRQQYSLGSANTSVLTDAGFRLIEFAPVTAEYIQNTTDVQEYQFISIWAKKASDLDAGRKLSIYSF